MTALFIMKNSFGAVDCRLTLANRRHARREANLPIFVPICSTCCSPPRRLPHNHSMCPHFCVALKNKFDARLEIAEKQKHAHTKISENASASARVARRRRRAQQFKHRYTRGLKRRRLGASSSGRRRRRRRRRRAALACINYCEASATTRFERASLEFGGARARCCCRRRLQRFVGAS